MSARPCCSPQGSRDMCLRAAKKTSGHPPQEFVRLLAEPCLGGVEAHRALWSLGTAYGGEQLWGSVPLSLSTARSGLHFRQQQFTLGGLSLASPISTTGPAGGEPSSLLEKCPSQDSLSPLLPASGSSRASQPLLARSLLVCGFQSALVSLKQFVSSFKHHRSPP